MFLFTLPSALSSLSQYKSKLLNMKENPNAESLSPKCWNVSFISLVWRSICQKPRRKTCTFWSSKTTKTGFSYLSFKLTGLNSNAKSQSLPVNRARLSVSHNSIMKETQQRLMCRHHARNRCPAVAEWGEGRLRDETMRCLGLADYQIIRTKAQELQFNLEKTSETHTAILFIDYLIYFDKEQLWYIINDSIQQSSALQITLCCQNEFDCL